MVEDLELERKGRRLGRPAGSFLLITALLAIPGILLVILTGGAAWVVGIVLLALAIIPAVVGVALLLSSGVARWAARHKLFA